MRPQGTKATAPGCVRCWAIAMRRLSLFSSLFAQRSCCVCRRFDTASATIMDKRTMIKESPRITVQEGSVEEKTPRVGSLFLSKSHQVNRTTISYVNFHDSTRAALHEWHEGIVRRVRRILVGMGRTRRPRPDSCCDSGLQIAARSGSASLRDHAALLSCVFINRHCLRVDNHAVVFFCHLHRNEVVEHIV